MVYCSAQMGNVHPKWKMKWKLLFGPYGFGIFLRLIRIARFRRVGVKDSAWLAIVEVPNKLPWVEEILHGI